MLTAFNQQKWALGCPITFTLVTNEPEDYINTVFAELWTVILQFEKRCSRFIQNSELSQLNSRAGLQVPVSEELFTVLQAAKNMAELTTDVYNPFVLPALQRAGYVQSMMPGSSPEQLANYEDRSITASSKLKLHNQTVTIPYGTALDLGGCGKGFIGDQLASLLVAHKKITGFCMSLGGDIICGGTDHKDEPWEIHVQSIHEGEGECLSHILKPAKQKLFAAATSTTTIRKGIHKGKAWHHLIDPKTGQPANSDVELATVCGSSLLVADVLASCAVIVGSTLAAKFVSARGATDYLLQTTKNVRAPLHSAHFYEASVY